MYCTIQPRQDDQHWIHLEQIDERKCTVQFCTVRRKTRKPLPDQRPNSWMKSRKSLESFSPCYSQSHPTTLLEIFISSNSRNLLQFRCRRKEENHTPFPVVPYPLPYGLRNPYRNLKSENSQDFAQKPKRVHSWNRLQFCTVRRKTFAWPAGLILCRGLSARSTKSNLVQAWYLSRVYGYLHYFLLSFLGETVFSGVQPLLSMHSFLIPLSLTLVQPLPQTKIDSYILLNHFNYRKHAWGTFFAAATYWCTSLCNTK